MDPIDRTLEAVAGYLALGMPEDAAAELASLPEEELGTPAVMQLRLQMAVAEEAWISGVAIGGELKRLAPGNPSAYILTAYCLRELENVEEARETLMDGPDSLREEPIFYYNLACYESLLGALEASLAWLKRALELDEYMIAEARKDRDLENLRAAIGDDFSGEFA